MDRFQLELKPVLVKPGTKYEMLMSKINAILCSYTLSDFHGNIMPPITAQVFFIFCCFSCLYLDTWLLHRQGDHQASKIEHLSALTTKLKTDMTFSSLSISNKDQSSQAGAQSGVWVTLLGCWDQLWPLLHMNLRQVTMRVWLRVTRTSSPTRGDL